VRSGAPGAKEIPPNAPVQIYLQAFTYATRDSWPVVPPALSRHDKKLFFLVLSPTGPEFASVSTAPKLFLGALGAWWLKCASTPGLA
jgi:hypothetical protein